jgi:hypothetical protein
MIAVRVKCLLSSIFFILQKIKSYVEEQHFRNDWQHASYQIK